MVQDDLVGELQVGEQEMHAIAIQICVMTALREVPTKLLMRRFCLIHLKKVSI